MKTAGWIMLVVGILAFFGAALKGNSVFGPCFWIALGAYLLYRANNKDAKEDTQIKSEMTVPIAHATEMETATKITEPLKTGILQEKPLEVKEPETLVEIQSQMTLEQREAAMCMVALFGGYADMMPLEAMTFISSQAATFFGIAFNETFITGMLARNSDSDRLIDTVMTIKPKKAKEFLLLTCHDFVVDSSNPDAGFLLENIARDTGYDSVRFHQLVNAYK